MRIQHNIMAMNAYRNYNNNTSALSKNLEKLSSGYKINRAGDDAAGLAISEKMRAQITGLNAAQKNVKDGISLVKTAEGAMQEIHDMLNRMDYLATQSANGTYDDPVDRYNLQKEVNALKAEINRIADSANFNGIQLLDGSLAEDGDISILSGDVTALEHADPTGIVAETGANGGGTKGTYSIDVTKLFGDGDKLTFTFGSGSAYTAGDDTNIDALLAMETNSGKKELAFGTDIKGTTVEDQAASIADALGKDANITAQFDISVDGYTVTLTNKNEGNDQATVSSVVAIAKDGTTANTKADVKLSAAAGTTPAAGVGANTTISALFDHSTGWEFEDGDVVTLELTDAAGKTWKTSVTVEAGANDAATATNFVNALNDAKFEDTEGTIVDESTFSFSDFFTASAAGTGSVDLQLAPQSANGAAIFGGGSYTLKSSNANVTEKTGTITANGTAGVAAGKELAIETTTTGAGDANLSYGDKLTIEGTLADQNGFSIDLIAGKDFDIGDDFDTTLTNISNALSIVGKDITLDDGTAANTKDIFGDDKEIAVAATTGKLTFTPNAATNVTTASSNVTSATLTPADTGAIEASLLNGAQKSAATSTVTFDADLEEGATVTVGNTEYQIVKNAADADEGKTAVVVSDLSDSAAVANAFKTQLDADANGAYTTKVANNKVTITTADKGSDVQAVSVKGSNPSHDDSVLQLSADKIKAGSTITINGKTFEFVDSSSAKAAASDGNIAVSTDLTKADSKTLADALSKAINEAGIEGVTTRFVNTEEDGTTEAAGRIQLCNESGEELKVEFEKGTALTLQIGDTSDSYNQLAVSVGDMHTWAMKIDGIDIGTQKGAQAAIDVIKNAINYVSDVRGDLGAVQNRLDHTANNLSVMAENIQDAESTIRDTDVAEEMMAYTKNNILIQSAQAMLAQANAVPQGVLQLLG